MVSITSGESLITCVAIPNSLAASEAHPFPFTTFAAVASPDDSPPPLPGLGQLLNFGRKLIQYVERVLARRLAQVGKCSDSSSQRPAVRHKAFLRSSPSCALPKFWVVTRLSGAVFPSLLKQDPR